MAKLQRSILNWKGVVSIGYPIFGTIKRTVWLAGRPVRYGMPLQAVDVQALPPYGWCVSCGAEVYVPGREKCSRCAAEMKN